MKKEKIVAIRRDNLDRIIEFKTDNNKIYNYEMAKEAIFNNIIENAKVVKGKDTLFHIVDYNFNSFQNLEEF